MDGVLGGVLRAPWFKELGFYALSILGAAGFTMLVGIGQARIAVAGAVLALLCGGAYLRPQLATVLALVFLTVLGEIRRLLIPVSGWSGQDPLMLAGPAIAVLLVGVGLAQRQVRLNTPLSRFVLVMMAIMALQMFNPVQGGLAVGVAGALFYMVPLFWFWIGRTYLSAEVLQRILYRVVVPLAVGAALFGLYQTFYGPLPHQQAWLDLAGHVALYIGGTPRAFSFFLSPVEHTLYLSIGVVLLWALWLRGSKPALLLIPVLVVSTFLVGSRGPVVFTLFTGVVLWTIQGRTVSSWLPRIGFALAVGVFFLVGSMMLIDTLPVPDRIAGFVDHQTRGLLNPLDEEQSTATGHFWMKIEGFQYAITAPLGKGLGATTIAAGKFGGQGTSTEMDVSDMFVSLGVVGGIVYVIIIALVGWMLLRYWMRTRSLLALGIIGILLIMFGGWLNGGRYSLAALVWLCIGTLDRAYHEDNAHHEDSI